MSATKSVERERALQKKIEDLERLLFESEETLRAIREGEVDAVVVTGSKGVQIFSLTGAETIYRLIVETMKEAALTVSFEGKILYCNARFGDLIKRTESEITGHSIQEFVDGNEKSSIPQLLLEAQKQPVKRRLVFRAADQSPVPAHISAILLNQPDQASICIVASDLRELENSTELIQQLRSANARTTAVLEQTSDCFAAFDREWRYTYVNPAAESTFHMSRDQLLGKSLWELWPAAYDLPVGVNFRCSMEEMKPLQFECFYPEPLNKWFEFRCYPTKEGLATFFKDITGQKQAESKLQAQTQLMASILDTQREIARTDTNYLGLLQLILERMSRLVGAEGASLEFADGDEMVYEAASGMAAGFVGLHLKVADSLSGLCMKSGELMRADDVETDPRVDREACRKIGLRSMLLVPLRYGNQSFGVLKVMSSRARAFPELIGNTLLLTSEFLSATIARKRAEEELSRSKQLMQTLLTQAPIGLAYFDRELRYLLVNDWLAEINGISVTDHLGKSVAEIVPTLLPTVRNVTKRILATGQPVKNHEFSGETESAPGVTRHWNESWYPVRDTNEEIIGFGAVVEEITQRKRAEERSQVLSEVTSRLLASENPQEVVESICRKVMAHLGCDAFFNYLVDEGRGCLHLNAYAGIPEEKALEIEWLDFGVAVCGCAARDACSLVMENIQTTPDVRTHLVRSFGIQAYAAHPLMTQGKVIGTLSFGSKTKAAFTKDELALMKTVTDSVAIAMQRVRLLESLNEQARAADLANKAKSQFLANMSHELRTPMNAILGMIDVALPKATDPTVEDCLHTAKGSADLLLTLLDDLLDSARIEAGKLELESIPFSIRRILEQTTRILSVRASEKGLNFRCRILDELPDAVIGDGTRLQQILMNLAGNAVKFTERGEVEINLRAHPHDERVSFEFSVRDTGIGIPSSRLEHIFQPFTQADPSMNRRFGGTGLGLPISKSLVEMMGGRIWVESEVNKGSTFHFKIELPLSEEAIPELEGFIPVQTQANKQLHILLAEDNPANQKLGMYVLQTRGHKIDIASDGEQAIRMAKQNAYDVILMDVQMPGMNGFEATAEIRKHENNAHRVPIIAMTAYAMKGDRDRCLAAGMDGYLAKPVNGLEMIGLVESLASGITLESPAADPMPEFPEAIADAQPKTLTFDPKLALERCYKSSEMLQEMIHSFFSEIDSIFSKMHSALEQGDLVEVGRLGHHVKGTVVYLGAEPAKEAALRVEAFSKGVVVTSTETLEAIKVLERECIALRNALREYQVDAMRL